MSSRTIRDDPHERDREPFENGRRERLTATLGPNLTMALEWAPRLTAGLERWRLLAVAMGGFTLANLLAALAPGYAGLLAARLLLALAAASFMPAASGYAAALGGPERRGRALSLVTNGLTLAIIAGVPLGRPRLMPSVRTAVRRAARAGAAAATRLVGEARRKALSH